MKKVIHFVYIITFAFGCTQDQSASTAKLIAAKDLKGLKNQKEKKLKTLNILKIELSQINAAISNLDPSEKLTLISMFEVKPENFDHYLEIQANIKTRQNVLLFPEFSGTLKKIFVKEGQKVKKGELLVQIDDAGLKNQLEQMQIKGRLSKTTYERTQKLWNKKIGSEMQLLKSKADYESQLKSISQLRKQLQRTQILAPFSGTIDEIVANTGSSLVPGQTPVLRIVNLEKMYTEANVPERYLKVVKKGTSATVEIPMLDREYSTTIRQTGNFINPTNRSFRVETPLPNTDEIIKPNLSCKLKIKDYTNTQALMVPVSIIRENAKGEKYIFKLIPDGKDQVYLTKQVFVQLGMNSREKVEVLKGIKAGDLVVNEGARIIENNQRVKNIQ